MPGIATQNLEKKFLKAFLPFHKLQTTIGWARFHRDNTHITRTTKRQKILTIIAIILNLIAAVYCNFSFMMKFYDYPLIFGMTLGTLIIFEIIIFFLLVKTRLLDDGKYHEFIINLQLLDYVMGLGENKVINEFMFKMNTVLASAGVSMYFITFIVGHFSDSSRWELAHPFAGPLLLNYAALIVESFFYVSFVLNFILRIKYINAILQNFLEGITCITEDRNIKSGLQWYSELAAKTHNFESSHTDIYLKELFVACEQFHKLYQCPILCSEIRIFVFCFCFIEMGLSKDVLILTKENALFIAIPTYASIWDLLTMALLVLSVQVFFWELKKTKVLSLKIVMQYTDNDQLRRRAMKMVNLVNCQTPEFTIYDMWHISTAAAFNLFMFLSSLLISLYGLTV